MFKNLKKKLILLNMTMMSVVMILAFTTIFFITSNNVENINTLKLSNALDNALRHIENQDRDNYDSAFVGDIPPDYYSQTFSIIVDKNGTPQFDISLPNSLKENLSKITQSILSKESNTQKIKIEQKHYKYSINSVFTRIMEENDFDYANTESYKIITVVDITDSQNMLKGLLITFIIIGTIVLCIIFIISVYFSKRAVLPVETSYIKQKQFIADASHELKTPLFSISANVDALKSSPTQTVISQKKWLDYVDIEIESMSKLINDLLYLAKNDGEQIDFENLPTNLSDIVNNAILTMEAICYEKGLTIKQDIDDGVIISGDSEKITQVIKILLDNAVKYVDHKGDINILLKETKNNVIFKITNTGEGIESVHLKKIFDRFYRVDQSRKNDGSYGLGLSIAKAIVESMGGKISVSSIVGQSTTFTVTLNK